MFHPIADLHCDLLYYLAEQPTRSPYDQSSRCSISQLRSGHVKFQTLAVFAETGSHSVKKGLSQLDLYAALPSLYPDAFIHFKDFTLSLHALDKIAIAYSLEGASTFCDEQESIQIGLDRLQSIIQTIGKPIYISLTWNTENRFGGGSLSNAGLKDDGKRLLNWLHKQGIAIDFSHASDRLAEEIFSYLDREKLLAPVMASHSNSRSIQSVPRNLPDDIAKEIFKRKGLIGLNFYRPFVGSDESFFCKHVKHWLELGGEDHLCFGADFFYESDFPAIHRKGLDDLYFCNYADASCYPNIMDRLLKESLLSENALTKLANQNILRFVEFSGR